MLRLHRADELVADSHKVQRSRFQGTTSALSREPSGPEHDAKLFNCHGTSTPITVTPSRSTTEFRHVHFFPRCHGGEFVDFRCRGCRGSPTRHGLRRGRRSRHPSIKHIVCFCSTVSVQRCSSDDGPVRGTHHSPNSAVDVDDHDVLERIPQDLSQRRSNPRGLERPGDSEHRMAYRMHGDLGIVPQRLCSDDQNKTAGNTCRPCEAITIVCDDVTHTCHNACVSEASSVCVRPHPSDESTGTFVPTPQKRTLTRLQPLRRC